MQVADRFAISCRPSAMDLTRDGALSRDELLEAESVHKTGGGLEGSSRAGGPGFCDLFATQRLSRASLRSAPV